MRRKYKKRVKKFPFVIVVLFLGFVLCVYYYLTDVRPLLEEYVNAEMVERINLIITRKTAEKLKEGQITYESLIDLKCDSEGRITSLTTRVDAMNKLKLEIEEGLLEELLKTDYIKVEVPIGSLLGGEFASGRGPCISVKVVPITHLKTEYNNKFDSAGMNQTRHRVFLNYDITLKMLLPGKRESREIKSEICIAETVIVGLIPNFYSGK